MKILTVVGARPQFTACPLGIKAAPVSKALQERGHQEFLVHTGQHYDYGMSQIFFDDHDCQNQMSTWPSVLAVMVVRPARC